MSTRTALLVAMLLVMVGATACSGDDNDKDTPEAAAPSTSPSVALPVPRPARDVCHKISWDQALAPTNEAETAPCERIHNAETFAVGELRTIVAGHLLAVDSAVVQQQVATTCPKRLATYAGGTEEDLRLSMLRTVWFTPSVEESDAGANWFRCDVIVVAREGTLGPLRGRLAGVLADDEVSDRYAMCGTAEPGAADFARVLCRAPHTWRAISTVDLDPGVYPGEDKVRAAGQDVCDDAARELADDALDYQWGYERPTQEQWDTGQTYGRCWAVDGSGDS